MESNLIQRIAHNPEVVLEEDLNQLPVKLISFAIDLDKSLLVDIVQRLSPDKRVDLLSFQKSNADQILTSPDEILGCLARNLGKTWYTLRLTGWKERVFKCYKQALHHRNKRSKTLIPFDSTIGLQTIQELRDNEKFENAVFVDLSDTAELERCLEQYPILAAYYHDVSRDLLLKCCKLEPVVLQQANLNPTPEEVWDLLDNISVLEFLGIDAELIELLPDKLNASGVGLQEKDVHFLAQKVKPELMTERLLDLMLQVDARAILYFDTKYPEKLTEVLKNCVEGNDSAYHVYELMELEKSYTEEQIYWLLQDACRVPKWVLAEQKYKEMVLTQTAKLVKWSKELKAAVLGLDFVAEIIARQPALREALTIKEWRAILEKDHDLFDVVAVDLVSQEVVKELVKVNAAFFYFIHEKTDEDLKHALSAKYFKLPKYDFNPMFGMRSILESEASRLVIPRDFRTPEMLTFALKVLKGCVKDHKYTRNVFFSVTDFPAECWTVENCDLLQAMEAPLELLKDVSRLGVIDYCDGSDVLEISENPESLQIQNAFGLGVEVCLDTNKLRKKTRTKILRKLFPSISEDVSALQDCYYKYKDYIELLVDKELGIEADSEEDEKTSELNSF